MIRFMQKYGGKLMMVCFTQKFYFIYELEAVFWVLNFIQQAAAHLLIFVFYLAKQGAKAYSANVFQSIQDPREIN